MTVLDDLIAPDIAAALAQKYRDARYRFYWVSDAGAAQPNFHWHIDLIQAGSQNRADIAPALEQMRALYAEEFAAWSAIREHAGPCRLLRAYVNAYTFGTDAAPHADSDCDRDVTAIVYLNERWQPAWAGETAIFNEAGDDVERAVLPKLGRALLFPSARLHAARPVSRSCPDLRVVLVFKLERL
jgi:SM-20-related protein